MLPQRIPPWIPSEECPPSLDAFSSLEHCLPMLRPAHSVGPILLIVGCGSSVSAPVPTAHNLPSTSSAVVGGAPDSDTEDTAAPLDSEIPPLWDVSDVERALSTLLDDNLPNGRDFIDLFRTLALEGDPSCPGEDLAFTTPESSCISDQGWEYFGYAPFVDQVTLEDSVAVRSLGMVQISFVIHAPDGRTFSAGGAFVHEQHANDAGTWVQRFSGTFIWTGDSYPWIEAGTQVGWETTGERSADGHRFQTAGPIAVGSNWAYVDHLDWDSARCDGIPDIAVRVRDEHGRWYAWSAGADCSPCGEVTYADPSAGATNLGELCLDLSAAMQSFDERNDFPVDE